MGKGGGPKAQKELLSSARKRRAAELARQAEEAEEAEQPGGEGGEGGEQPGGEGGEGGEQPVFGKQLPSVAGPRGMQQRGGVRPPSPKRGGKRGGKQGGKRGGESKTKLVPYAQHVLGLQTARMEAAMVGKRRQPSVSDEQQAVYAATLSALSFVPPELAEGVARLRAREVGGGSAGGV
jgi:hypothetical protein